MARVINKERKHELTREYLEPVHVGKILKEFLTDYGISQHELAMRMRIPYVALNQICNRKRSLTPEVAVRLAEALKAFKVSAGFWLGIQKQYDLDKPQDKLRKELKRIEPVQIDKDEKLQEWAGA